MYIDKNDKIAEISILLIKKILAENRDGVEFDDFYIALSVSKNKTSEILKALKLRGLIQIKGDKDGKFELTELGQQFSVGSSMKQIARGKAEAKLAMFLERVKEVNESSYYLYSVKTVILFGSLASNKDLVSDIDLGYEFTERQSRMVTMELSSQRAPANLHFLDKWGYAEKEVRTAIKGRDPYLSLHKLEIDHRAILSGPHRYLIGGS